MSQSSDSQTGYWVYRWVYHWNLFMSGAPQSEYGPLQTQWVRLTVALGFAIQIAALLVGAAVVIHGYSW